MRDPSLITAARWAPGEATPAFDEAGIVAAARTVRDTCHVVQEPGTGRVGVASGGTMGEGGGFGWLGTLPAIHPEWLGDRSFQDVHGTRFAYVAGAMANGIATTDLVVSMAKAGMLGFFGAAGLHHERVEAALDTLEREVPAGASWGSNLIHSPQEPELERRVADLYVARGVRHVSASAYMALTPAIVRYAYAGVRVQDGAIVRPNHVFAKISRPEVARRFLSPPPGEMLDALVAEGALTADEAALARKLPVAEDYIVEADSGGHTDNRPLPSLFPAIRAVRDQIAAERGYTRPIRLGAAGGLGTPDGVAAAFALGAAFVVTGSVNQACVESGLSEPGRAMLANAGLADVIMAPAADMFELGVKVQVLKRGTMFAPRAQKLYDTYLAYPSLEAIPADVRAELEQRVLSRTFDEIWADTQAFWSARDPGEVAKAEADPRHKMALCFRWYLGLSSRWAITGDPKRRMDYQIWCGPAMGAFNAWTQGSFLEAAEAREAVQVALNLLEGAAVVTRAHQLRTFGVPVPQAAFHVTPRPLTVD